VNDLLRGWLDLPVEASTFAAGVDLLHLFVISATMLGATFVFLLSVYYVLRYRRKTPYELTANTAMSAPLELFIIGSLQTLFLVFWVVGAWQYNRMTTPPPNALTVYVTGKQWMWEFSYPSGRASMDLLTVPAGMPIKLVMTSRDVIHSFYVPAFRIKHDVVPGRYYTAWFTARAQGTFDVECAEYCGVNHSRMLGRVQVLSAEDYGRWLEGDRPPEHDLAERGRRVASDRGCFNCHTLDGQPHIGPSWASLYMSQVALADGRSVVADDAYLTRSMMEPQAEIVAGYKAVMPTYRGVLPEPEVAALVEFIRSIHGPPPPPSILLPKVVSEGSGQPQEPKP
jgi:cytochrome c oxidase subunit 2